MKDENAIEVPATIQTQTHSDMSLAHREQQRDHRLSLAQVKGALVEMKQVMTECMAEGQDYGKVPGCGDKPSLFQPGAQKLSLMFNLSVELHAEDITDYQNNHRGYRTTVRVSSPGKHADGVGECSTLESKYRYRSSGKVCPVCGKDTVLRSKQNPGEWFCWEKKGGCGLNFAPGSQSANEIEAQEVGQVENKNPADQWNTARKMAFKRGFVHAIINFTNTSELWSQDLEDLVANGVEVRTSAPAPDTKPKTDFAGRPRPQSAQPKPAPAKPTPATKPKATSAPPRHDPPEEPQGDWRKVKVHFGKNAGVELGRLSEQSLRWYVEHFDVQDSYERDGRVIKCSPEEIARAQTLRDALDEAVAEFNWTE